MMDGRDRHLYLLVLAACDSVSADRVVDAIPEVSLRQVGHTRDSARLRLADDEFWASFDHVDLHEQYRLDGGKLRAVRTYCANGRVERARRLLKGD